MTNFYGNGNSIFEEGFKAVSRGIVLFGASLVVLGLAIFFFPAVIGFLIAAFVLFVGIASLYAGYKVWKFRKQVSEWEIEPVFPEPHFRRPVYYRTHFFVIR
ncbi:MAG: hypothetical protein ACE5G9_12930 [Nitrospinales bacterium]